MQTFSLPNQINCSAIFFALACLLFGCDSATSLTNIPQSNPNVVKLENDIASDSTTDQPKTTIKPFILDKDREKRTNQPLSQFGFQSQNNSPKTDLSVINADPLNQAKLLINKQEWAQAAELLNTLIISSPGQNESLKLLATCYLQLSEFRKALPYLEKHSNSIPVMVNYIFFAASQFINSAITTMLWKTYCKQNPWGIKTKHCHCKSASIY